MLFIEEGEPFVEHPNLGGATNLFNHLSEYMNSNEWPRAVATASIWIAIGFALGFGLFRMNFTGGGTVLLPLLAVLLLAGGVMATGIVWRAKPSKRDAEQGG